MRMKLQIFILIISLVLPLILADCNNCSGSGCCSNCASSSCSQSCGSSCCNNCGSSNCNNCGSSNCAQNCNTCKCETSPAPAPAPPPVIIPAPPADKPIIVNNTNINQANHTANININNVLNTTNIIHIPITVNTTNINNIDIQQPAPVIPPYPPIYPPATRSNEKNVEVIKVFDTVNVTHDKPAPESNCCYVVHPRTCARQPDGQVICYLRRHYECSDICTSGVVVITPKLNPIIQPVPLPIPQPPVILYQPPPPPVQPSCRYVQQYPWAYCGNYDVDNCGSCYECEGNYDPGACSESSGCNQNCRANMFGCETTASGTYCL